jgi:hypothetical protein
MKKVIIDNCTLYFGNCLKILPTLGAVDTVITDPVWPNNKLSEFAHINPYKLFAKAWKHIDTKRAVIQLGCDSNPDILNVVNIPFFRVAWLEYALPGYKGRLLNTGNVAYMYGIPPHPLPGKRLVCGKCISTSNFGKETAHPCPRKLEHVQWLINQFTDPDDIVLDPFMGSGTTAVACINLGRRFIGIEIVKTYFNIACERIKIASLQKLFNFDEIKVPYIKAV